MQQQEQKYWHLKGPIGNELYSVHPAESLRGKLVFRIEESKFDKLYNYYLLFDNVNEYIFYFRNKKKIKANITAHELCPANLPRKFAFDVDIEGKTEFNPKIFFAEFEKAIQKVIPGVVSENITVYSSHNEDGELYLKQFLPREHKGHKQAKREAGREAEVEEPEAEEHKGPKRADREEPEPEIEGDLIKISYHIVIQGYHIANAKESRLYFEKFLEAFEGDSSVFDAGLYSPEHSLRAYGWKKMGTDRTKVLDEDYNQSSFENLNEAITKSLLSYVFYTERLPILAVEVVEYQHNEIQDVDVQKAIDMLPNKEAFEFQKIQDGGLVILRRLCSSFCQVCERNHDSNNAFLRITAEGAVLFGCYQSSPTCIGYLDVTSQVVEKEEELTKRRLGEIILNVESDPITGQTIETSNEERGGTKDRGRERKKKDRPSSDSKKGPRRKGNIFALRR